MPTRRVPLTEGTDLSRTDLRHIEVLSHRLQIYRITPSNLQSTKLIDRQFCPAIHRGIPPSERSGIPSILEACPKINHQNHLIKYDCRNGAATGA
jgi:hypothetical protein